MTTILDYYKYSLLATAAYVRTEGSNDAGDFVLGSAKKGTDLFSRAPMRSLMVETMQTLRASPCRA